MIYSPVFSRTASIAQGRSYDYPNASEVTMGNIKKIGSQKHIIKCSVDNFYGVLYILISCSWVLQYCPQIITQRIHHNITALIVIILRYVSTGKRCIFAWCSETHIWRLKFKMDLTQFESLILLLLQLGLSVYLSTVILGKRGVYISLIIFLKWNDIWWHQNISWYLQIA